MKIRKKVLAFALILTSIALLQIKLGNILVGIIILMLSLSTHLIHLIMYVKKVQ